MSEANDSVRFLGLRTALYAAPDLDRAKAWYTEVVGTPPYFDAPFYVGFNVGGCELGLDPSAAPAATEAPGVTVYWGVDDARAAVKRLVELGATLRSGCDGGGRRHRGRVGHRSFRQCLGRDSEPAFQGRRWIRVICVRCGRR